MLGLYLRHCADEQVVVEEQALAAGQVRRDAALQTVMAQIHNGNGHQTWHTHHSPELIMVQQQKRQRKPKHRTRNVP